MIGLLLCWPLMLIVVAFFTMAVVALWVLIDAVLVPGMIRDHNLALAVAYGR
jgi:hypothetical protein